MKKLLAIVFLGLTAFYLSAEARNALLIANGKYKSFGSLATPVNEARDLKKSLEKLGFNVTILENASKEQISDSLYDFEDKLQKDGGIGFFHYGGHAVQVNGRNFIIPVDADIPDERRVASRAIDVNEIMASMIADTNIVVLDACRNNPLPASSGRSATRGLVMTESRPKNSIIVYSASAGKVAQDGVFTPILTRKLLEQKSFGDILKDVRKEVMQKTNNEQSPGEYSEMVESVYLAGYVMQNKPEVTKIEKVNNIDSNDDYQRKVYSANYGSNNYSDEGYIALQQGNYKKAFSLFKKGCKLNEINSLFNLALQYEIGVVTKQNMKKAFELYLKAAWQGCEDAYSKVAYLYETGNGVVQNWTEAIRWYTKSAEHGDSDAQFKLGFYYENGEHVEQNLTKAAEWYMKSAEQGHDLAQFNLGWCYEKGYGVAQNWNKAVEWYLKSSEQGFAAAQCNLGWCYATGNGVEQNLSKAVEWYLKSAEQGYAAAQCNLGWCYETGYGVAQNWNKAVEWYLKSSEQGHAPAQCNLGWCYEKGYGVAQNWNKAAEWYLKSAEQGYAVAQYNLGRYYEEGRCVDQNLNKAIEWYRKAAVQGVEVAKDALKRIQ